MSGQWCVVGGGGAICGGWWVELSVVGERWGQSRRSGWGGGGGAPHGGWGVGAEPSALHRFQNSHLPEPTDSLFHKVPGNFQLVNIIDYRLSLSTSFSQPMQKTANSSYPVLWMMAPMPLNSDDSGVMFHMM